MEGIKIEGISFSREAYLLVNLRTRTYHQTTHKTHTHTLYVSTQTTHIPSTHTIHTPHKHMHAHIKHTRTYHIHIYTEHISVYRCMHHRHSHIYHTHHILHMHTLGMYICTYTLKMPHNAHASSTPTHMHTLTHATHKPHAHTHTEHIHTDRHSPTYVLIFVPWLLS